MHVPAKSVFFCATHRSGSTLLTDCIGQMDILGKPAEAFYPHNIASTLRAHGVEPQRRIEDWLPYILREGSSANGVFSSKLFVDNIVSLAQTISGQSWPEAQAALPGFFRQYFPGAVFIAIHRRDKFRQGISLLKAMQSGLWHSVQSDFVKPREVYYHRRQLQWVIDTIISQERQWQRIFATLGVQPMLIYYEDLARDVPGHIRRISEFAGVGEMPEAVPAPSTRKIADRVSDAWLERFQLELFDARNDPQPLLGDPAACQVGLSLEIDEAQLVPGDKRQYAFRIDNPGTQAWRFVGNREGTGDIDIVLGTLEEGTGKTVAEVNLPTPYHLGPGEFERLVFHFDAPDTPGTYLLRLAMRQRGGPEFTATGLTEARCTVACCPIDNIRRLLGPCEARPDRWCHSPWFGYLYGDFFPWVYSASHGWLKFEDEDGRDLPAIRFYDFTLGPWSTTRDRYPEIEKADGTRLTFRATQAERRVFLNEDGHPVEVSMSKNET
jgi:LPS sulfotransferase NodH